jgi:CHAT domain-containing protein
VKYSRQYEAFVLHKMDKAPGYHIAWIHLGDVGPIKDAIHAWRKALTTRRAGPSNAESPERMLRRLVWEQIEPHLAGCRRVIVIPDLALTRVPWAALPGQKDGSYLLDEDYAFSTALYGQHLYQLLTQDPPQGNQLLLVNDVDYDHRQSDGPSTARQPGNRAVAGRLKGRPKPERFIEQFVAGTWSIEKIWNRFGKVVTLKGRDATESNLCRLMPGSRYVHLLTHGYFADPDIPSVFQRYVADEELFSVGALTGSRSTASRRNPQILSGVELAGVNQPQEIDELGIPIGDDGVLTPEEIADLDLSSIELLVLAACETGLGDVAGGEGVFGLQRGFGLAGARATVDSLWKVDADAMV